LLYCIFFFIIKRCYVTHFAISGDVQSLQLTVRIRCLADTALTLSNLQRRQSGMYECLARNSLGMTHASAHLAVIDTLAAAASDTTRPPNVPSRFDCKLCIAFYGNPLQSYGASPAIWDQSHSVTCQWRSQKSELGDTGERATLFLQPADRPVYSIYLPHWDGKLS